MYEINMIQNMALQNIFFHIHNSGLGSDEIEIAIDLDHPVISQTKVAGDSSMLPSRSTNRTINT